MQRITLSIIDSEGNIKLAKSNSDSVKLTYKGEYHPGDKITLHVTNYPCFLKIRLEDSFEPSIVYLNTDHFEFTIPFGDGKRIHNSDKSFCGGIHLIEARTARNYEINNYQDLALNPFYQNQEKLYPTVYANTQTKNIRFARQNLISGLFDSSSHGSYPYTSWSNNQDPEAELTVDFGRLVEIYEVVLYLRADFPHDSWWESVELKFDDGTKELVYLSRSGLQQKFTFSSRKTTKIILTKFAKSKESVPYTALSQIEVLGRNL